MINKLIEMTRGDTLAFDVTISEIEDVTVESLYFSVKKKASDTDYVFQKSIGNGITKIEELKYRVRIAPEDTYNLPAGKYRYDLQLKLGSDIYTPLMGSLIIDWDVTEEIE